VCSSDLYGIELIDSRGQQQHFDGVVLACHADQSLSLLTDANEQERHLLGAFEYQRNRAILHSDTRLMPKNKKVWSSWNYLSQSTANQEKSLAVSYWMNQLQPLATQQAMILTLNPPIEPEQGSIHCSFLYDHPVFNEQALQAQKELYTLQGQQHTWFCGSYFGYGFHEDGLQSGLAVAEDIGAIKRPWQVDNESGRIFWPSKDVIKQDQADAKPSSSSQHSVQPLARRSTTPYSH
jgi:predicted NAD/FAD-binding protein